MVECFSTVPVLRLPFLVLEQFVCFLRKSNSFGISGFRSLLLFGGCAPSVFYFMSGAYAPGVLFCVRCLCAGCFYYTPGAYAPGVLYSGLGVLL